MSILSIRPDSVRPSPSDSITRKIATAGIDWQGAMKRAIRDPAELVRSLELPDTFLHPARAAARQFGLFAPREFVARMEPGDPDDPLLRQVLPIGAELAPTAGFSADPVGDLSARRQPGLLQKYHGRVLLIVTGACPVHCRYCFRRHFPYSEGPRGIEAFAPVLEAVSADASISEVIFSGGDPLTVVDEQLGELTRRVAQIPHVERLRIHTRMPIMIPQRVTAEMLDWLTATRLTPIVVVHANHPQELDDAVAHSLAQLADAGVMLLNQSVLLRGINDDAQTLIELSQRLLQCRTMPYYLHQLDRVAGSAHFEVPQREGRGIVEIIRQRLPGYLVPRYALEEQGELSKTMIV